MQNVDDEELLQCPYDPHHRIRPERMQVHLGRCRRNHKHHNTVTCPFNVTHVISKLEIDLHVKTCESRISFEKYKYREDPTTRPTAIPIMPAMHFIETSENWDDEPDVPTYNARAHAASANILRELKGESPSQKKRFRETERLRLIELRNNLESKLVIETNNKSKSKNGTKPAKDMAKSNISRQRTVV